MGAQPSQMTFKCLNPECQQKIRLDIPKKSGIYKIVCPHCGITKKINIKGQDVLGQIDRSSEVKKKAEQPIVDLGEDFLVNTFYEVVCPHCQEGKIPVNYDAPGTFQAQCPACGGKVGVNVRKPTEIITRSELIQRYRGKLILLRRGWLNKDYPLRDGSNIVGRYDKSKNSDIAIKGDSGISRQSIEILVDHHDKGYSFKLTVRNSTNPVFHNNKPLAVGDSISLNFGDSIILGKTKFRFEKEV